MPADLSVIVPPLAQARSLEPDSTNDAEWQRWSAPDGACVTTHTYTDPCWVAVGAPHDSPAWPGLLELAVEIRRALGDAS